MDSMKASNFFRSRPDNSRSLLLLLIGALVSIAWSVYFAVVTLTIPYQIELREGTAQVITRILLSGENPFVLENLPLALTVYGVGYNLVVLPFAFFFGNTLLVHRAVTFSAILLSFLAIYATVYKTSHNVPFSLIGGAFVLVGLIGRSGIGAFPAGLGTFLFLASMLLPFRRSYDSGSLFFSALLALAAFYTKPYFVMGVGIVASFVFLFVSMKKALVYALGFSLLLIISFFIVRELYPLYFFDIIISNMSMSSISNTHLVAQLQVLFFEFLPVLVLLVLILTMGQKENKKEPAGWKFSFPHFSELGRPFIILEFDYLLYIFLCALTLFLLVLGRHAGSYMNYAYQLIIPTFCCWFFSRIGSQKRFTFVITVMLLFNLFTWQKSLLDPRMLEQRNSSEWARFFDYLHSSKNILNSPVDVSEITQTGLTPIDAGQTILFYLTKPFLDTPLVDVSYKEIVMDGYRYTKLIDRSLERKNFDLVVAIKDKSAFYNGGLLDTYYLMVDEIVLDMPQSSQSWTVLIYKPKPE